jgi:hypothetical protein
VRKLLTPFLVLALVAPAYAAGPTATTSTPQPAPGSPFSQPVQDLVGQPPTETTVTATKRASSDSGRSTLLFLSLVALLMIFGVAAYIWHEGRHTRSTARRRRQRLRSGRTPQPAAAGTGARRGPPPSPRKRRAAKRKKR